MSDELLHRGRSTLLHQVANSAIARRGLELIEQNRACDRTQFEEQLLAGIHWGDTEAAVEAAFPSARPMPTERPPPRRFLVARLRLGDWTARAEFGFGDEGLDNVYIDFDRRFPMYPEE